MNVVVFGATGGLGRHVSRAVVAAGHEVVLFVRSPRKVELALVQEPRVRIVAGDVLDETLVRDACEGVDVAINCTSPAGGDSAEAMVRSIVAGASSAGVRAFYLVGGLGALWVPGTDRTVLVQDWDDAEAMKRHGLGNPLPRQVIRRMTRGHLASMAHLQTTGLPHAYVCPGQMVDGPASDATVITLDELGGPAPGRVPYADVAAVVVDDLERGWLLGHRVCVSPAIPSDP